MGIGMSRSEQGGVFQRRENLLAHFLRSPSLSAAEERYRLLRIDTRDQFASHVLMRETEGVAGFVTHHAVKLRLRSAHGECLEVHRRLTRGHGENVRSEVGPVPRDLRRR